MPAKVTSCAMVGLEGAFAEVDGKSRCLPLPADDLPIAAGLLMASGQIPTDVEATMFVGDLSLDGTVRHVNGVLSMASLARTSGIIALQAP